MASINLSRVVAGGLVAGAVANAIDFVTNTYLLAADWAAFAPTRNLDPAKLPIMGKVWPTDSVAFNQATTRLSTITALD